MKLAPSILSFDLANLVATLPLIEELDPEVIHLDVMDGQFVPPITFGSSYVQALKPHAKSAFEAHLMTLTPERHFQDFISAGCGRITFHAEATMHLHRAVQLVKSMGAQVGVAINPGTPVEHLLPVAGDIDLALVMTVNPGWGGQKFVPETLEKIRRLRSAGFTKTIQVDGGIDPSTIRKAKEAGADLFVVGSYFANAANMKEAKLALEEGWA